MGTEQPGAGGAAEGVACDYIRGSFVDWGRQQEGSPEDLWCKGLRSQRSSLEMYCDPTLAFYIQVKNSPAWFSVPRSTFGKWVRLCTTQPVFLLALERLTSKSQKWRYLTLHDWLMSKIGQEGIEKSGPVSFNPIKDFTTADDDDRNLHDAFLREANRAIGAADSIWATSRDYGLLPVDEGLFLEQLGFTEFAEVPIDIYRELDDMGPTVPMALRRIVEGGDVEPNGSVIQWLRQVEKSAFGRSGTTIQRHQFRQFTEAMVNWFEFHSLPRLPLFEVSFVGTWRCFSAMYPRSIQMYEGVIRHSKVPNDIQFASAMISMLANTNDRATMRRVEDSLTLLKKRRSDDGTYGYQRELLRAPAEAGDARALKKLVTFVEESGSSELELTFLNDYGWKPDLLRSNLSRKICQPTLRDVNLKRLYECMANLLLQ